MLKRRYIIAVLIISIICGIHLGMTSGIMAKADSIDTNKQSSKSEGRLYIEKLEELDPVAIENEMKTKEKKEEKPKVEEQTNTSGNVDFKKYFKNTIFIGDSITEFISEAELLPKSNVFAEKGKTVLKAKTEINKLKNANPERVIILFGMNDVVAFQNVSDFKNEYLNYVNNIKKELPNTKIYLESPTAVQAKAENREPGLTNARLIKFKEAVSEISKETDSVYVDLTELASSGNYYEPDGIHFNYNFYKPLFNYLKNIIDKEQ